ncbi:hypothetical protein MCZ47_16210 [Bacillus altitudinis]|uniref:hypothetical protein n=1 Tax=Bacillus altitudinis TaxID=293387 RepID=UPI00227DCF9B|nr:hypothetical protein [Bacillus altitudinis]MCY7451785.1 hypothetical protein [Bacillus altitudinis]
MAVNKRESVGNLNVKVDVDVSDAIKGLKAVQRAAKDATKALAELEAAMKGYEKAQKKDRLIGVDVGVVGYDKTVVHAGPNRVSGYGTLPAKSTTT